MSEYQYYEFQAIDRPLGEADLEALRNLSTRARITATSFVNTYEWGDFKGDPAKLMEQWFDLHLHLANWGTRRLMIRWPARVAERLDPQSFIGEAEGVEHRIVDGKLILDIFAEEVDPEDWEDGSGWLAALAPLRADVLAGDLRLFYLLWLTAVQADALGPEIREPLPGLGPMTAPIEAFAEFFQIDPDLVAAAAEQNSDPLAAAPDLSAARAEVLARMPEAVKTRLLARVLEGDTHVVGDLRSHVRQELVARLPQVCTPPRTVGQLRARAEAIYAAREREETARLEAEQRRQAEEAERQRRARLDAIRRRGESVWREIEEEIERSNAAAYDRATNLLSDLAVIAKEDSAVEDFRRRLLDIRARHARKSRFLERLRGLG
ncbi:MAG TPA: hypothetical protein VGH03_04625 [Caulobacteraceae bacterium]|jgi:hypothetical protein